MQAKFYCLRHSKGVLKQSLLPPERSFSWNFCFKAVFSLVTFMLQTLRVSFIHFSEIRLVYSEVFEVLVGIPSF